MCMVRGRQSEAAIERVFCASVCLRGGGRVSRTSRHTRPCLRGDGRRERRRRVGGQEGRRRGAGEGKLQEIAGDGGAADLAGWKRLISRK